MNRGTPIPGFAWDEERQRYFKIDPSHAATPASVQYTRENVKRKAVSTKKRKRREEERAKLQRETVKRPRILSDASFSATTWILKRETSASPGSGIEGSEYVYAHGLQPTNISRKWGLNESVKVFDYDTASQTIAIGTGSAKLICERRNKSRIEGVLTSLGSEISSVHFTRQRRALVTTLGERDPPRISLLKLKPLGEDYDDYPFEDSSVTWQLSDRDSTIWTSAVNHFNDGNNDGEIMAIGTSNSVMMLDTRPSDTPLSTLFRSKSDTLSLEWLNQDVLASGTRRGAVVLWDRRVRSSVQRILHQSSVIGIKRAGSDNRLIVAGFQNRMGMYDLRMASSTHPVFNFQEYENIHSYPFGFDVFDQLGVVATAQERGVVQLNSMRTGKKLRRLELPATGDIKARPTCLKFIEETEGKETGRVKLLVGSDRQVIEWAW